MLTGPKFRCQARVSPVRWASRSASARCEAASWPRASPDRAVSRVTAVAEIRCSSPGGAVHRDVGEVGIAEILQQQNARRVVCADQQFQNAAAFIAVTGVGG